METLCHEWLFGKLIRLQLFLPVNLSQTESLSVAPHSFLHFLLVKFGFTSLKRFLTAIPPPPLFFS